MNLVETRPTFLASMQSSTLAVLATLLLELAVSPAQAATRYWEGGSADIAGNGDGNSDGDSGTWNTTLKNWDQGSGLAHVAWTNGSNEAEINGGTQTITLGANIILGGITQKAGGSLATINGGSGPFTLTLNITGANTFLAAASSTTGRTLAVNAVIAGAVGKNLVIAGPDTSGVGTVNLGGANTFSGTTSFSSGATSGARVYLNHQLALQNSTVTLSNDANVVFNDSVSAKAFTFGGLAASSVGTGSNLSLLNDASIPIALTVGGNNSDTTYKGVLSGGGSLIKTGSGTLILAESNTYTGTTTVSAGSLEVDGSTTSPTTVNNGTSLAGDGTVNAAVTVAAGGSVTPGSNNLTVSNLTFSSTGALNVGTLSYHTSTAAVKVNSALTVSGGAGSVTVNLPTAPGFNGTYRLIQFGSGPANASGFTLGTVPALAWNQSGTLQVNGGFLNYVITAAGDTSPPTLSNTSPANNAANVLATADLVATFNESVVAGSGSIELRKSSDNSLVESFNVTSSTKLTFSTTQLIINPTNNLPTGQSYYILIPAGAVEDTSGNNYAGITSTTGWKFTVPVPAVLYTDTGSPANPLWSTILPTLNVQSSDPGPVLGSVININNAAVEVGLYGNRPISIPSQRIHVACNTASTDFADFTRWFQTDGKTHILRVFVNDENTATSRPGTSSHTEAFTGDGWNYTDNTTYEWTARYTIAKLEQGYCCFQLKNNDHDWAVQLNIGTTGSLTVNNRNGVDVAVTNPDGSAKNFDGRGFDVRVLDDGLNYKVWIDGVLYASSNYSRPTGTTNFRWGMYFGANNLNPPSDFNIVLVSGAQIQSWPGNLNTATATITKENNATNLDNGNSWVGTANPGIYKQALWNSTVTSANSATLASDQDWAGIKIVNPGGAVTINGTAILGLDDAGLDMTTATQNLTVNCPVQMVVSSNWNVASGRTARFNGIISGYPGLTLNGAGTVQLEAANTFSGDTTVSAGTLVANDNSALGAGRLLLNGGNLSNTASCTLGNDVSLNSNAAVSVAASQTLTLNGSIAGTGSLTKNSTGTLNLSGANTYTGATIVSAGTLDIDNTSALLTTSSLTLAGGTLLEPNLDGVIISAPITVASSGTTATISAPTNNPGGVIVSTLTLRSILAGSGNVTFSSSVDVNALSTVYLGGQSTYAGSTLMDTDGTSASQIIVKLGINNALPTTTVLTIDGQIGTGTGRAAELNLNGFNQQLAGLTNTARSLRVQRVVNSDISAPATLTINNSSNHTFSGNLGSSASGSVAATAMPGSTNGNNFGLTKSGVGTFTLSGANTYTGSTTVSAGILSLANSLALQNSEFKTLDSIAGNATNGLKTTVTTLTLGGLSGDKNLASVFTTTTGGYSGVTALTLNPDTGATFDYSGIIANGASNMALTKTGLDTQILSGANTYTGITTVSEGTLSLTGNRTLAATGGISVGNLTGSTGTLNITNGTFTVGTSGSTFLVGNGTSSTGILNQSGGSLTTIGNQLLVGNGASIGIYNLSGGVLTTIAGSLGVTVGVNSGATATFNLSGTGTISMPATSTLQIGRSDNSSASGVTGTFNQTGGTATVGILQMGGSNTTPANNANAIATLNLSGGTFSAATFNVLSGANTSNSIINISGTAFVTLPSFPTARGSGSTATLTFNGGTLKPLAASAAYMGGLTNAFIKSGGATFDTTNGSITISQALLTDVVSTGGGLTKNGSNTLTLSGASTYTGTTTISAGTLALGANNVLADTTNVSIDNATLNASTFSDSVGTLDITGNSIINLGTGGTLAFADSHTVSWTGGTLNLTGTFVSGSSIRFGTNSSGLTSTQLALISSAEFSSFALNASGYLTATATPPFSSWITSTFTGGATVPTNKRGPHDDPDNDGICNLIEYAIASQDPTVANASIGTFTGTSLTFAKRPGTAGLTYAILKSTDLGITNPWTVVSGPSYVNDTSSISFTLTPGSPLRNFIRLQVISN